MKNKELEKEVSLFTGKLEIECWNDYCRNCYITINKLEYYYSNVQDLVLDVMELSRRFELVFNSMVVKLSQD